MSIVQPTADPGKPDVEAPLDQELSVYALPGTDEGDRPPEAAEPDAFRILVAEDDSEMRALLTRALRKADYEVIECADGMALLDHLGAMRGTSRARTCLTPQATKRQTGI